MTKIVANDKYWKPCNCNPEGHCRALCQDESGCTGVSISEEKNGFFRCEMTDEDIQVSSLQDDGNSNSFLKGLYLVELVSYK